MGTMNLLAFLIVGVVGAFLGGFLFRLLGLGVTNIIDQSDQSGTLPNS